MRDSLIVPAEARQSRAAQPVHLPREQLLLVRQAVADTQQSIGLAHLAEGTLRGDGDQLPMVQAAALAVRRALEAALPALPRCCGDGGE